MFHVTRVRLLRLHSRACASLLPGERESADMLLSSIWQDDSYLVLSRFSSLADCIRAMQTHMRPLLFY